MLHWIFSIMLAVNEFLQLGTDCSRGDSFECKTLTMGLMNQPSQRFPLFKLLQNFCLRASEYTCCMDILGIPRDSGNSNSF